MLTGYPEEGRLGVPLQWEPIWSLACSESRNLDNTGTLRQSVVLEPQWEHRSNAQEWLARVHWARHTLGAEGVLSRG